MTVPGVSVILPAHNPDPILLGRTLAGLRAQTLPADCWELLIIDNASIDPGLFHESDLDRPPQSRVLREETLGLTAARLRGFAEARGDLFVLVDDDNVLAPDYLEKVVSHFAADAALGAIGGRSRPEFERPPLAWTQEFESLLAIRDLGEEPLRARWINQDKREYPICSPIGAGMALRRSGAEAYAAAVRTDARRRALDRVGTKLVSGGDNDLVMTILETGLEVAYAPDLSLTHLVPSRRSNAYYLGALNRAIARSWVRVLALHGIVPWPPIPRITVPFRRIRSWWRERAWEGPAEWVRWQGRCGTFEGRADIARRVCRTLSCPPPGRSPTKS